MRNVLTILAVATAIVVALAVGALGGILLDREVLAVFVPPKSVPANATSEFQLLAEAWNTIERVYVDRSAVQPQKLAYGAVSGMVDALGDTGHSRFLTPEMLKQENNFMAGEFEGIGAEVQSKDNHVVIVAPMDNSPAQKAGLKPGDIILKVNGQDISELPLDQVVARILGPAGTQVTLTILTPGTGATHDVTMTRARIPLRSVSWQRLPGTNIAHLRITQFSQGVSQDLEKALKEIQQQKMTGVVLDLRNDPGGLLDEAVGVASEFLKSGNVLLEKDAQGKTTPVPVQPGGVARDIPMVVLINNGTASAAEIVAGSLQDARRGKLVGETTFGTGTVLSQFRLSDGSALMLAIQEWLTPSGRVIWHHGITPDISVPLPSNATLVYPEMEQNMTADQLKASPDKQLLRALDLLTGAGGTAGAAKDGGPETSGAGG